MRAALATAAIMIGVTTTAHAEPLERAGRNALVLDSVAGLATFQVWYPGVSDRVASGTRIGALTLPATRLGYHRFVGSGFSLGAGFQLLRADASFEYGPDVFVTSIAPRVGWAHSFSRGATVWLRAGVSVLYGARERDTTFGQISLGGEAVFVARVVDDFALTVMPFIESGVSGREEAGGLSRGIRFRTYGVTLGALIAF